MPNIVPDAYLTRLRDGHPHRLKCYLSIILPSVVYCGKVSGSPAFGARDITVTDESGTISNIQAGQTVYVGTSCSDFSISKRRLKSRSGQVLTLDENTVTWVNGQYITVVDSRELWNIWPYITPDEPYTFYKDYDIAYTDQNLYPNPVAIIDGNHKIGFLDDSVSIPSITFTLDATDSYTIAYGATIATYAWSCTGGYISNPSAASTSITFTTTGTYWLKLIVTDSNGKTQSTWRIIRVHDKTTDVPYDNWFFNAPIDLDLTINGARTSIVLHGDVNLEDYPDNALAIIWCEQTYNGEEYYYEDNIKLAGHIRRATVQAEPKSGIVTFDIETINSIMANSHMMSVSLEYSNIPTAWYQMYKITVGRALHHYWKWHSTLFEVTNVYLPMEELTELVACDDFDVGDLLSTPVNFAYQHSIFANIMADCHDSIRCYRDINLLSDGDRASIDTLFTLTSADHKTQVDITLNTDPTVGHVIVSGGVRNASTNMLIPIISQAPGEVPLNRGAQKNTIDRLVIATQAAGNTLAGRVLANLNRYVQEIRLPLSGNYFDIFSAILPQYWLVLYDIDNPRNISTAGNYTITAVSLEIDNGSGSAQTSIVVVPEVSSVDGIPGPYPPPVETPGGGGGGGGTGSNPPWSPPTPPPPVAVGPADVYVAANVLYVKASANFDEVSPNWVVRGTFTEKIIDATVASWDYEGNVVYVATEKKLYRCTNFQAASGWTWETVLDLETDTDVDLIGLDAQISRIMTGKYYPKYIVYVVLAARTSAESADVNGYLVRSFDSGDAGSWSKHLIYSLTDVAKDYTVDKRDYYEAFSDTESHEIYVTHERFDGDEEQSPWGIARTFVTENGTYETSGWGPQYWETRSTWNTDYPSADVNVMPNIGGTTSVLPGPLTFGNEDLDVAEKTLLQAHFDDYFGVGGWGWQNSSQKYKSMPKETTRINTGLIVSPVGYFYLFTPDELEDLYPFEYSGSVYVFFHKSNTYPPRAADCGKSYPGKIYIGLDDKIVRSTDYGETWEDYILDTGANDIMCHGIQSQFDDDITFWAIDGKLYRTTGSDIGSHLYTETGPVEQAYRLGNNPHSPFPIFALAHTSGGTYILIRINDATGSSIDALKIDITGGAALLVKEGADLDTRRIFLLISDDILLSDGDEEVYTSKLGDWTAFGNPTRIQPL